MNKRLKLAVLSQALIDCIENGTDEDVESALEHLSAYPQLIERLIRSRPTELAKWKERIEKALGRN